MNQNHDGKQTTLHVFMDGNFQQVGKLFIHRKPFMPFSPKNYQMPKDFPRHDELYSKISSVLKEKIGNFPECCDPHRALSKEKWFKGNTLLGNHIMGRNMLWGNHIMGGNTLWGNHIVGETRYGESTF